MSEKGKAIHTAYCDYQVTKANNTRTISVKPVQRKPSGIRTANISRAMLAQQLASLF